MTQSKKIYNNRHNPHRNEMLLSVIEAVYSNSRKEISISDAESVISLLYTRGLIQIKDYGDTKESI